MKNSNKKNAKKVYAFFTVNSPHLTRDVTYSKL